jgi:hypothetical protein
MDQADPGMMGCPVEWRQGWEMALDEGPFGVREVAEIRRTLARQRTVSCHLSALQNTLSILVMLVAVCS